VDRTNLSDRTATAARRELDAVARQLWLLRYARALRGR